MFKSKIHRATITGANIDYNGSIEVDGLLLDAAKIRTNEQVHIWNITNGNRLVTYAIRGKEGSGIISINGGAALLMKQNELCVIATFCDCFADEADKHQPTVVLVDAQNKITSIVNQSGGMK